MAGVLLSSMHQSYLGGLYLIALGKVHPLWYSQYMHAMFYLSAIPAGLALMVMAIYLSMRSLNVRVDFSILSDCGRMIQLLLIVFAFFKVLDLTANQALGLCLPAHQRSGILLAGDAAVPGDSYLPAELGERALQSRAALLEQRDCGRGIHG